MNINVNSCKEINCEWYEKQTDTGVVLNFHSCAPFQHRGILQKGLFSAFLEALAHGKILTKLWREMKIFDKKINTQKAGLPR